MTIQTINQTSRVVLYEVETLLTPSLILYRLAEFVETEHVLAVDRAPVSQETRHVIRLVELAPLVPLFFQLQSQDSEQKRNTRLLCDEINESSMKLGSQDEYFF